MQFENLEQFINEPFVNRAKWLREAEVNDLATVMPKHPEFADAVRKTVSCEGRRALDSARILNYEESLTRLTKIEFKPANYEIKEFPED